MAKTTGIKGLGALNKKTTLPQRDKKIDAGLIEQATKKIHQKEVVKGKTKRVSLDFPLDLYTKLKMKVFSDSTTNREYLLNLVRQDLGA